MWLTALLLGFAGSFHCAGMCSPLSLAVSNMRTGSAVNRLLYNAGRIFTYSILGAVIAAAGDLVVIDRLQAPFSLLTGGVFLVAAMSHLAGTTSRTPLMLQKLTLSLKAAFSRWLKRKSAVSLFSLGMINGLMPCGLTMAALAYCITLQEAIDGFNFMIFFGAGTLPAMLGMTGVYRMIMNRWKINMPAASATLLFLSGLFLVIRPFVGGALHAPSASIVDLVLCR